MASVLVRKSNAVQAELGRLLGKDDRIDSLNVRLEDDDVAVDGVVLVDQYASRLNATLAAKVAGQLDRDVRVSIVQLRQQTNAAAEYEEQLGRRLAALEQREDDSRAILAGLTVGELVARDRVLIDAQARRAIVQRDREAEGEQVAAAIDRIMASVQAGHPQWLIQNGALTAAEEPEDAAAAEAPAAE